MNKTCEYDMLCDIDDLDTIGGSSKSLISATDEIKEEYKVQVTHSMVTLFITATHSNTKQRYEIKLENKEEDCELVFKIFQHSFENGTSNGWFITTLRKINVHSLVIITQSRDCFIVKKFVLTHVPSSNSPLKDPQSLKKLEQTVIDIASTLTTNVCDMSTSKSKKLEQTIEMTKLTYQFLARDRDRRTIANERPIIICDEITEDKFELSFGFIPAGTISIKVAVQFETPVKGKHSDRLDMFMFQKGFQKNRDRWVQYHHCARCGADMQMFNIPWRSEGQKTSLMVYPTGIMKGNPKGNYSISLISYTASGRDTFLDDLR
jgi:hypothetical protein